MLKTRITYLLHFISICYGNEIIPFVQTPLGEIRGYIKTSFEGRKFAAFEGVPYAKPPIGNRRFEAPEPAEPWLGTWDAVHLFTCLQIDMGHMNITHGDEDCLYINIYVPRENPNRHEKLDVVVHIHGGAYMYGSGHYYTRPDHIMDRNMIFVTFNYRLGLLGFLSTEDDVVPGNNGMKDQVLALKWIQQNIASFGGNSQSVTLTGLSAGGASVHLHYFSEMSKGLFHRGLSQSGVALNTFSLQKGALEKAKMLGDAVGCPLSNTQILVHCLKKRPYKHLLSKSGLFFGYLGSPLAPFAPIVEKCSKPFLSEHPYQLLTKRQVYDVPWVVSNTAHEGYFYNMFTFNDSNEFSHKWKSIAPFLLDFNYTLNKDLWNGTLERIREFYFGKDEINKKNVETFTRLFGDRTFIVDAEDAVRLHAKATNSSVYYYLFSYPGDSKIKYVSHGDDSRYFYGNVLDPRPLSENEIKMKDVFLDMLVTYAKTGAPIINGVEWKPTKDAKEITYLNIKGPQRQKMQLETVEELSPRSFWKSLGFSENANLFKIKDEV